MDRLGFTWYPKDWRSNMLVSELSLQEKGFYRELIDECFLQNSAKIRINERTFCRLHGINRRTFRKLLENLCETSLIVLENFDETLIVIPSVVKRLGIIERASSGGKGKALSRNLKSANIKEKEKENIKENIKGLESLRIEFTNLYPKPGNPIELLKSLQELLPDDQQKAIKYIPIYIKNTESKYIKSAVNYLKSYCWNDKPKGFNKPKKKILN